LLDSKYQVIVVGGGLAGLISSILLKRAGLSVLLIEKKQYPFNRVCGEYISNEVRPFLEREGLYPNHLKTSSLERFELSDIQGNTASIDLPLGGFGVSRYQLDNFLYEKALLEGVSVKTKTEVAEINFYDDLFEVAIKGGESLHAEFVIGAFGKRSKLDKALDRSFIKKSSPFIGVKYHAYLDFPADQIGLYNFDGGYCGISQVEGGLVNICYLSKRDNLKKYGNIKSMEEEVLYKNPLLKQYFEQSTWLREKPEVINEISFEKKEAVKDHILMAGDTAGLITPLCGNGMAMAIHAGKIAADCISQFYDGKLKTRKAVEYRYKKEWSRNFDRRLFIGRSTQNLFGNQSRSNLAIRLIRSFPAIAKKLIKQTHGDRID
jgi:flavin-dependent dehydrogenase